MVSARESSAALGFTEEFCGAVAPKATAPDEVHPATAPRVAGPTKEGKFCGLLVSPRLARTVATGFPTVLVLEPAKSSAMGWPPACETMSEPESPAALKVPPLMAT